MAALRKISERLAFLCVMLSGVGLLACMFGGVADIVGTRFGHPISGVFELTESAMVLIVFGGLAYAQLRRRHLRVELLYLKVGPRLQSSMDILTGLSGIVFFTLLVWQGINEAVYSWSIGEATSGIVRFPLYPARIILVIGSILLIAQLCFDLVDDIGRWLLRTGGHVDEGEINDLTKRIDLG